MIASLLRAAAEPASAPVTQWPLRMALVLVVIAVIALVLLGMRRGWRRRARAQEGIPAPLLPAEWSDGEPIVQGVFLGTTAHGDWLDRIVVHDLGVRSRVEVGVGADGISLWREGARDVLIPSSSLRDAAAARGIAGKAYERNGVLVITWELGGRLMDTGVRADVAEEQDALLRVLRDMVNEQGRAGGMSR